MTRPDKFKASERRAAVKAAAGFGGFLVLALLALAGLVAFTLASGTAGFLAALVLVGLAWLALPAAPFIRDDD